MKRPNFFIIGAPKCGTTSLASWLGEHPNIFMSKPKEPQYFNTDYSAPGRPASLEEYEKLFKKSSSRHKAVGEATTGYLMSEEAVPNILNYCPSARFIVCLRSPIEMVQSRHAQLLKMGIESEPSLKVAWRLQEARHRGENVPATCPDKKILFYDEVCMLGLQMERLFQIVFRHQVLVIFLEDMKSNPRREYRRVLEFLEVEDDGREDFPVENARALPRFPLISQSLRIAGLVKTKLGLHGKGIGIGRIISRLNNRKPDGKQKLSPEMEETLRDYFKEDIGLLSSIMGRELSHWLQ
ncbi:MAG: sulfotransferase domain-containing protein [Desulfobacteraceae bacterium]|nr:sulfotransferase domain-containing protein [Desulfobacteraceae bacterium]